MTTEEFLLLSAEYFADCHAELTRKAKDYQSGFPDALDGVFEEARQLGVRPTFLILVHINKHMHAVRRFVIEGNLDSETIWSRLKDIANYCIIMQLVQKRENYQGSLASAAEKKTHIDPDKYMWREMREVPHVAQIDEGDTMCSVCGQSPAHEMHGVTYQRSSKVTD